MSEIADALLAGKTVEVDLSITGAELKAARLAYEAALAERDARQRRLLVALWNAAWWIQLDIECREEAYRNPDFWEIKTEPERTEIEEAWKSHAEYVAVLRENGVDPNKPIDQQLPEDAPLPAGYWRGAK